MTKREAAIGLTALALAGCGGPRKPPGAPSVSVQTLEQLPTPLPKPYDEGQQAMAAVDAAFVRAKAEDKRVIVDLGGNWCPWCRMLAGVMALPEVKPFVDANFEVVSVDVSSAKGQTDRNLDVVRRFGMDKVKGFPWLVVAEPDGRVLASSYEVTDEHHQTPQAMVDWLAKFAKRPAGRYAAVGGFGRA
jgi:thiol-disulfide isomerase/thioredoxin